MYLLFSESDQGLKIYAADTNQCSNVDFRYGIGVGAGLEVIKLEFILRLKIKCNDWLIADTCPQAANHWAFILSLSLSSSFITSKSGLLKKTLWVLLL